MTNTIKLHGYHFYKNVAGVWAILELDHIDSFLTLKEAIAYVLCNNNKALGGK